MIVRDTLVIVLVVHKRVYMDSIEHTVYWLAVSTPDNSCVCMLFKGECASWLRH